VANGGREQLRRFAGRRAIEIAAVAGVYFGVARFGLLFAFATKQVTAVWPPTGVALVALLLFGYRVWPGVLLGAFLANAMVDEPLGYAAGIALGNTLGPLLGAFLLRRVVKLDSTLTGLRDVFGLIVFGAILGMTLTATNGVLNLALAGIIPWGTYPSVWWVWWVGDAMGVLLVAPPLLTWAANPRFQWTGWRAVEFVALFSALLLASHFIFAGARHQIQFFIFPFLIWAALRFGQRETASAVLLLAGVAIWETVHQRGPFATGTLDERLVLLEAFLAVAAIAALVLGAVTTERRNAEDSLRRAHDELEQRVRERTAEIERMRAEWNSIIAHDLRQPITVLTMSAQLLAGEIAATSELHKPAVRILKCASRLGRLVRELLDYSQLEARRLELARERIDVPQLVSGSIESVALEAPDRRFDVRVQDDVPPVKADADRIAQVIDNLLTNAIKYGTPQSTVVVEVGAGAGMVTVAVTNQGVGIGPEELPQLFQRFARTEQARQSGVGGLGLGLYIARQLIEAHGGSIAASSTPGASTTFHFTLPIGWENPGGKAS
jgi:signal transduction histidine kinase